MFCFFFALLARFAKVLQAILYFLEECFAEFLILLFRLKEWLTFLILVRNDFESVAHGLISFKLPR